MAEIAANKTAPKCEYMSYLSTCECEYLPYIIAPKSEYVSYPSFLASPIWKKMSAKMRFSMTATPNRAPIYAPAQVSIRQTAIRKKVSAKMRLSLAVIPNYRAGIAPCMAV